MDRLAAKNEVKMLLVSAGDTGKSAMLRAMKLIHHGGFSDSEREAYKEIIYSNIVQFMGTILEAMPQLDLVLSPQNDVCCAFILSLLAEVEPEVLPADLADVVRSLWQDPAVKEAVRCVYGFGLNDSPSYYFNSIDRIATAAYVPTDQDILLSEEKTTGIKETVFKVGDLTYKLFDVDGQRNQRRKWIHCFDNAKALLFLVSLTDYDQTLSLNGDESVNCLEGAFTLFDSICNSRWFANISIILLMNDIDAFAEKLPRSPLEIYFPDYKGGNDYDAACGYLLQRFVSLNQSSATKQIYAHYISVRDTQQIKFVLSVIQDIVLQLSLKEDGVK